MVERIEIVFVTYFPTVNPSLANFIAGSTTCAHGILPCLRCASSNPRSSPGTAIAKPPSVY
jgi:hypothetical protein